MSSNPMRFTPAAGAMLALACVVSTVTSAAQPAVAAPIVVAQAAAPSADARTAPMVVRESPAYQRGVWDAAAQGPEALRRYIWRTRMIYNYYYQDFVPRQ